MSDTRGALAEDVFVGISHSVPVIKFFWKAGSTRLSRAKITELLEQGKAELHDASQVLVDPVCEDVLSAHVLNRLKEDYCNLHTAGTKHSEEVGELKALQIYKKYKVWIKVEDWTRKSRAHKYNVWSMSDWARIYQSRQEQDSTVGQYTTAVEGHGCGVDSTSTMARRFITLAVHTEDSSESFEGDTETTDSADHDDARLSDMDSIFGNPFLGYTVEIQQDGESTATDSDE
ncbi:hypothetical protein C2E23DRAFT_835382 [Lenzites betulinus]|nr:hypothetical protein C2E23DRAFT_835382 [Lenzites betulinus]